MGLITDNLIIESRGPKRRSQITSGLYYIRTIDCLQYNAFVPLFFK